jgi:NRAMP (natural resistance-associated macrophage protein)-like metal ion transporter
VKKLRKALRILGPGFITGASDDDPSGIGTYSQTGAMFGYSQLWMSLFSLPLMIVVQEMCGRIGIVTGSGLAGVIRRHYAKKVLYVAVIILLVANTINIGADLGAMASAAQLLVPIPFDVMLIFMTLLTLVLEVFVSYRTYSVYLKYLTLSLLTYVVSLFVVKQDWHAIVLSTLIPTVQLTPAYLMNLVAFLGTTISPYMFFWQASEEVEEQVMQKHITDMGAAVARVDRVGIRHMRQDTIAGMTFSNVITFFIIATTASTLFAHGLHNIQTATDAAQALRPLAGPLTSLLFAMGVLGTGLLAVPVLAGSASYALSEAFGWRAGLYRKFSDAHGFYGVITIATLIGLLVNFTTIKPFTLLYYTAVLNGLCAPPLIFLILKIANDKKVLGKYVNSPRSNAFGYLTAVLLAACAIALMYSLFRPT